MNFPQYTTTFLEDWVTNLYKKYNINFSSQIKPSQIARSLGVFIKLAPLPSRYDVFGRYKAILIDDRLPIEKRREHFFHELGHLLRHVGHQSMMPEAFRELQEWDAQHFTLYASLPLHMISKYDYSDPNIIETLSEDFKVTESLCTQRLLQVERKSKEYATKQIINGELFY
ncbi:ImmA/IrrE family metallo-endopeptidase [Pontibacillus salipaludis]|uniref:IrrE N-terminal-like domain-containing protein n=1 Tax=Pontibacillus salipaludis TaxID=1697394 RepID=A0ABQ1PW14_9BACI|nr:ImmA/IrrE family metallo-endopeptidase [Pontibacillus salipaludis]GGD05095.1 hypothetical protein GCM10011389_10720 [Pontibacillus salipaludis]